MLLLVRWNHTIITPTSNSIKLIATTAGTIELSTLVTLDTLTGLLLGTLLGTVGTLVTERLLGILNIVRKTGDGVGDGVSDGVGDGVGMMGDGVGKTVYRTGDRTGDGTGDGTRSFFCVTSATIA